MASQVGQHRGGPFRQLHAWRIGAEKDVAHAAGDLERQAASDTSLAPAGALPGRPSGAGSESCDLLSSLPALRAVTGVVVREAA